MKKRIEQLEVRIMNLLGKSSYTQIFKPCRGKYAGTNDYGLLFNDGTYFYISNSKKYYEQKLLECIEKFEFFHSHKEELTEWTKRVITMQNANNEVIQIEFEKLYIKADEETIFGFVVFDCNIIAGGISIGKYTYVETNYTYHCLGTTFTNYVGNTQSRGFVIGQMKKKQ